MKPARLLRAAGLVLPAFLLSGCLFVTASGSFGPQLDPEVVARIVPGESTKRDVLALLGPPHEFVRSEVLGALGDERFRISGAVDLGNRAQDAFTYQHETLSGNASALLLYNYVGASIESDLLVIFFDPDDRVREVAFRTVSKQP